MPLAASELPTPGGSNNIWDDELNAFLGSYDVTYYGADPTGVADSTTAIQNAIADLPSSGGVVWFPNGTYKVTATITISTGGIILRGESNSVNHFGGGRTGKGVEIQWAGANDGGPVFDFSAPSGGGVAYQGGGMDSIAVYCSNNGPDPAAAIGIRLRSCWKMVFRDVAVKEASTACWQFTAYSTGFTGGDATIHNCQFYNCSAFVFTQSGIGFQANATSTTGGITLSSFFGCFSYSNSAAAAVDLSACDDLFFYGLNVANNVGHTIELRGKNTASGWYSSARNIHFFSLFAGHTQSIYARAGDGSDPSHANVIYGLSFEDGYIAPVIEAGASLTYYDTRGMLVLGGQAGEYGIDMNKLVVTAGAAIRLPNNLNISGRNAAGSADVALMKINTLNEVSIDAPSRFNGAIAIGASNSTSYGAGANLAFATSTGTKIGTATSQLIGFWNATPAAQQVLATGTGKTVDNVITFLQSIGLCRQS